MDEETDQAFEAPSAALAESPPCWSADRLDLTAAILQPHLGPLKLPPTTLAQVCAALSTDKHLRVRAWLLQQAPSLRRLLSGLLAGQRSFRDYHQLRFAICEVPIKSYD